MNPDILNYGYMDIYGEKDRWIYGEGEREGEEAGKREGGKEERRKGVIVLVVDVVECGCARKMNKR